MADWLLLGWCTFPRIQKHARQLPTSGKIFIFIADFPQLVIIKSRHVQNTYTHIWGLAQLTLNYIFDKVASILCLLLLHKNNEAAVVALSRAQLTSRPRILYCSENISALAIIFFHLIIFASKKSTSLYHYIRRISFTGHRSRTASTRST